MSALTKTENRKTESYKLFLFVALFAILLVVRDIMFVSVSKYVFVALALAFFVLSKEATVIYMLCFVFPLVCGLPGNYIFPIALVVLIFKNAKGLKFQQVIFMAVFILAELLAAINYQTPMWSEIIGYLSALCIIIFLLYGNQSVHYDRACGMFLLSCTLLCAIICVSTLRSAPSNWLELFAKGWFRFGEEHISDAAEIRISLNANALGYYSLLGIVFGFVAQWKAKGMLKVIIICMMVFDAFVGIMSVSRSFIIFALLFGVLCVLSNTKGYKQVITTAFVVLVVALVLGVMVINNEQLMSGIVERFKGDDIEGANGRFEIFQMYTDAFFSKARFVLLGTGVTDYKNQTGVYNSFHNGIQQVIVSYGIILGVALIAVLFYPVFKSATRNKVRFLYLLPMLAVVLFTQTIQFVYPTMLMLPIIPAYYAIKSGEKKA